VSELWKLRADGLFRVRQSTKSRSTLLFMRHRRFLCSKPLLQDYTIRQDELIDRWTPYPKSSPRSTSSSDDIGRETFVGRGVREAIRQDGELVGRLGHICDTRSYREHGPDILVRSGADALARHHHSFRDCVCGPMGCRNHRQERARQLNYSKFLVPPCMCGP